METNISGLRSSATLEYSPVKTWNKSIKLRIAYIEEPPFYWTGEGHLVKGADIELAEVVLQAIGVS
jgi:polar amino acid transport system substrate-binding protein